MDTNVLLALANDLADMHETGAIDLDKWPNARAFMEMIALA